MPFRAAIRPSTNQLSVLYLGVVLLVQACGAPRFAPIDPPALRPIGDAKNWMLVEPIVYRVGHSSDSVIVPKGFVTDFASIPPALQSFISQLGPYLLPAVVHDYLYWEQSCSKSQADSLFLKAMTEMRVRRRDRAAMYEAVHVFGGSAWVSNARERSVGMPRVVPDSGVRPPEPLETWSQYRAYLYGAGIRPGPKAPIATAFCELGGSSS
jgi:hypothetical protein